MEALSSPIAMPATSLDVDKLSNQIFSILENKFLFGEEAAPASAAGGGGRPGRVRILSIDGGGRPVDGLLAAASLARLEAALRARSGDPYARVADFFDVAAGSGAGGVLAAMLFLEGPDGRPKFTAEEAFGFIAGSLRSDWSSVGRSGALRRLLRRDGKQFRRVFGEATLKDTVAPVLIPCYDLASGAPFLFSRADAVENASFDFRLRDVCAATCAAAEAAVSMRSVDCRTAIAAVGGGVAMGNPTAAAITHVLNNKQEFPLAAGVGDLLVISLGCGEAAPAASSLSKASSGATPSPSPAEMVRITADGVADMIDQSVAMAFGSIRPENYVRIQACGGRAARETRKAVAEATAMLAQRNVESALFRGRKLSERTNAEKLDDFAGELVKEQQIRRRHGPHAVVVVKRPATPRASSATGGA